MTDALPDPAGRRKAMRSEGLSTAIFTSFDELASVRDEWDEFIESAAAVNSILPSIDSKPGGNITDETASYAAS